MPHQLSWHFPNPDPVIRPGQLHGPLDAKRTSAGHILDLGDRYRIYYWASGSLGNVILMAESPIDSPNDWRPVGGPLLVSQPDTDHNFNGPSFPYVFPVDGNRWHMLFCAWGKKRPDGTLPNSTNLALSDDAGLTWRYHSHNPVLPLDKPYDHSATGSVCVLRVSGEFRLYYTAIGPWFTRPQGVQTGHGDRIPTIGIAYATSTDAITWHKPLNHLLIAPRFHDTTPYEYIVSKPFLIHEPHTSSYRLFVSTFGHAYRIRSLTSPDALHWTHVPSGPDGDLGIGASSSGANSFDSHQRSYACVLRHKNQYRLWYTGNNFGDTGLGYATANIP
jgi:hypothetical protein